MASVHKGKFCVEGTPKSSRPTVILQAKWSTCHFPFHGGFCCCHIGFPYLEPSLDSQSPAGRRRPHNRGWTGAHRRAHVAKSSCTQPLRLEFSGFFVKRGMLCFDDASQIHPLFILGVRDQVCMLQIIPICTCVVWIFRRYSPKMMGKMSLPTLQNGAPNYTIEGQKTMIVGMLTFSFSPVIFMVVGSYFSKTFTIRFLCIMQHSIVDFLSLMVEKTE